ncbi:MAG: hypothetical protein AAF944_16465 [Bacteroidota bacterium]
MKVLITGAFLSFICLNCPAQKLLFHKNRNQEVFYEIGDKISFRLKGSKDKIAQKITGFQDSLILFRNYQVNPSSISHLHVDEKTKTWYIMKYKYDKLLLIAGIGYPLIDLVNSGELDPTTLIIGGSLISAGLLARWFIKKTIKIRGNRRLIIVQPFNAAVASD